MERSMPTKAEPSTKSTAATNATTTTTTTTTSSSPAATFGGSPTRGTPIGGSSTSTPNHHLQTQQAVSAGTTRPTTTTNAAAGGATTQVVAENYSCVPQTLSRVGGGRMGLGSICGGGKGPSLAGLPLGPNPSRSALWSIQICPTTGGQFQLCSSPDETIDGLKKAIAKKLKLTKERITLLNKERVLKEGSLRDNAIFEGCKLTLLPNIESGLMSQRPEHTVMQALENLSDIQVNDFLSGKSPLTLAMRLGDHMMFVQLQLSTSPPNTRRSVSSSSAKSAAAQHSSLRSSPLLTPAASLLTPSASTSSSLTPSPLSLTQSSSVTSSHASSAPSSPGISPVVLGLGSPGSPPQSSPIGCLPTPPSSPVSQVASMPFCSPATVAASTAAASQLGLSPFMIQPHITQLPYHHKQPSQQSSHYHHHHQLASVRTPPHPTRGCSPATSPESTCSPDSPPGTPPAMTVRTPCTATSPCTTMASPTTAGTPTSSVSLDNMPLLDSSALAEASRNLSAKLKELSQASNVAKELKQTTQTSSKANGAIIESMQHHGQGIYSGTFSGTLNPALQDRDGKPKRSISTIVHILNDLLGATPQYRAQLAPRPTHPPAPAHHHHHRHHHSHHQHHHQQPHLLQADRPHRHYLQHAQHRHQNVEASRSRAQGEHSRLSQENRATRGKMEQIQQMLEERRVRRRARREARATPYGRGWASSSTAPQDPSAPGATSSGPKPLEQPMEVDVEAASNMAEVQEKAGYGELTQETVVA